MSTITITKDGLVRLPPKTWKALGVRPGEQVDVDVRPEGVVIKPRRVDLLSLQGALKPRVRGVTMEDMEEAIARGWAGEGK